MFTKPLITEKTLKETALNRYTFLVDPTATKHEIKTKIETIFKVNVVAIRTISLKSLTKRSAKSGKYQDTRAYKKAIVELKPKQTIKYFETK